MIHGRRRKTVAADDPRMFRSEATKSWHPIDSNQAPATEILHRIAGGCKFGLYLLLSTQRPSEVHQNVISHCDNLLLMKTNSASDLRSLSGTSSNAPKGLVEFA